MLDKLYVRCRGYMHAEVFIKVPTKDGKIKEVYYGSLRPEVVQALRDGAQLSLNMEIDAASIRNLETCTRVGIFKELSKCATSS